MEQQGMLDSHVRMRQKQGAKQKTIEHELAAMGVTEKTVRWLLRGDVARVPSLGGLSLWAWMALVPGVSVPVLMAFVAAIYGREVLIQGIAIFGFAMFLLGNVWLLTVRLIRHLAWQQEGTNTRADWKLLLLTGGGLLLFIVVGILAPEPIAKLVSHPPEENPTASGER